MVTITGILTLLSLFSMGSSFDSTSQHPKFRLLVVASRAKDHLKMIAAARPVLEKLGEENHFAVDFTDDADTINSKSTNRHCLPAARKGNRNNPRRFGRCRPARLRNRRRAALFPRPRNSRRFSGLSSQARVGSAFTPLD